MPKYPLTDRQKNMIRSLVPGLENGDVKTEWLIVRGDNCIQGIFGLDDDGTLRREVWNDVRDSDFSAFEECGFFECTKTDRYGPTNYTLNEYLITEAVKHDFEVNDWQKKETVNQFNLSGDFSGSVLNIASTLTDVQQTIGSIPGMDNDTKTELAALFDELQQELANIPEEHANDAEAIVESAKMALEQLNRDKPNKTMLSVSVEGLKKAAENIASILPNVAVTAGKIVKIIIPFI
jgi:hypothetical protein